MISDVKRLILDHKITLIIHYIYIHTCGILQYNLHNINNEINEFKRLTKLCPSGAILMSLKIRQPN